MDEDHTSPAERRAAWIAVRPKLWKFALQMMMLALACTVLAELL